MKIRIDDTVVDLEKATAYESSNDQQARLGRIERLYRSTTGAYYKTTLTVHGETLNEVSSSTPQISAQRVTEKEAAIWLVLNNYRLPKELAEFGKLVGG